MASVYDTEENYIPSLEEIEEVLNNYLKTLANPDCHHCDGTGTIAYICPCTNAPGHLTFPTAEKIYKLVQSNQRKIKIGEE